MSRPASPSTGRPYGLQRVCRIFGVARSTAYFLKAREAVPVAQRPVPSKRGPVGAGTDEELLGHIRRVLSESPFTGEGYRKVWARLRHRGIRTAAERVRRLMRGHHLQAPGEPATRTARRPTTARSPPRSPTGGGAPT